MNKAFLIIPVTAIVVTLVAFGSQEVEAYHSSSTLTEQYNFVSNLSIGDYGEEVLKLQKFLNEDASHMVSAAGAGSPGNETRYFGSKTKQALITYQNLHSKDVLKPVGLAYGTGYFGPSTRAYINNLNNKSQTLKQTSTQTQGSVSTQAETSPTANSVEVSSGDGVIETPQLEFNDYSQFIDTEKGMEAFLDNVRSLSRQKGYDEEKIEEIVGLIRNSEDDSEDTINDFMRELNEANRQARGRGGLHVFDRFLFKIATTLVPRVNAATGIPFGGRILFAFYCNCSNTFLLTLTPLPPTQVALLSYFPGTQLYSYYTLPYAINVLGTYAGAGTCSVYVGTGCGSIPSRGMITPMVGSSL